MGLKEVHGNGHSAEDDFIFQHVFNVSHLFIYVQFCNNFVVKQLIEQLTAVSHCTLWFIN